MSKLMFQKLLLLASARLMIYLFKMFQDCKEVHEHYTNFDTNFFLISLLSLVTPPLFYIVYLIGSNFAKDDILDTAEIGTKTVNGFLLFPWQIKRHLDVLHFAAQRVCQWRSANEEEKDNVEAMKRNAEILEFFEDFYSGFLQILLQLYIYVGTIELVATHTVGANYS